MKNISRFAWPLFAFGLWLLSSQRGQCFYSPQSDEHCAALVNSAEGTTSALHEYGPFGELLRATGLMAKANPFRFSTKYQDDETDLLYYGYRYYNANAGRWLSRDPVEEESGVNLYGFVENNPIYSVDNLGNISYQVVVNDDGIPFPDNEDGTSTPGATKDYTSEPYQYDQHCGFLGHLGRKLNDIDVKVQIGVYYAGRDAKNHKMSSGVTAEQHENGHVAIIEEMWARVEYSSNYYGRLCFSFCGECHQLRKNLIDKFEEFYKAAADMRHAGLDFRDYSPGAKKMQKEQELRSSQALYETLQAEGNQLLAEFNRKCK